ncbi:MAG: NAD-dependent epimerase/dehydratase family protein [Fibrobacterota bacterium]
MSSLVVFGGSGFVGTHLTNMLGDAFERIYIADIRSPGWHLKETAVTNPRATYVYCDVRKPIDRSLFDSDVTAIINLAAVHTSPGHEPHEYFETNITGARHVCDYASDADIKRIVFTSSISVYGPGEDEKTEDTVPMPAIPYGSSKIIAEYIHREWLFAGSDRRLSVVRPAVIFGIGEGGNFTRIANTLEKGIFAYPGRTDTVKGCLYVKDLCRYILQRLGEEEHYSLVNFCYPEKITIQQIVRSFKKQLGYKAPEFVIPWVFINGGVSVLNTLNIPYVRRMGIVPDRLIKLVKSTNISSNKLKQTGFTFQYPLDEALADWSKDCNGKTLY